MVGMNWCSDKFYDYRSSYAQTEEQLQVSKMPYYVNINNQITEFVPKPELDQSRILKESKAKMGPVSGNPRQISSAKLSCYMVQKHNDRIL